MSSSQRVKGGRERGFTLIEIMVVVVIIGLLAAIVAPNLIGNIDRAAVTRARADIRTIDNALNLYRLDNFRYPSTDEGLEALVTNPGEASAPNWKQYLRSVPTDPWNNEYQYASPGRQGDYEVFTLGANGQEGGEGIDADIGTWNLD
ncbi:MAG: type II secretion system major pseudopilin GspG [Gammaproteobacteria bacterium]|nr:type II secretion system major pseudopilin GspG [Gammaproteobacteria bacterium]